MYTVKMELKYTFVCKLNGKYKFRPSKILEWYKRCTNDMLNGVTLDVTLTENKNLLVVFSGQDEKSVKFISGLCEDPDEECLSPLGYVEDGQIVYYKTDDEYDFEPDSSTIFVSCKAINVF